MFRETREAPARRSRSMLVVSLLLAALTFGAASGRAGATEPLGVQRLTVDREAAPAGIAGRAPSLGWRLTGDGRGRTQSAYRVLVASSQASLDREDGDVWDSGEVRSNRSESVPYGGPALTSGRRYFWKVRVWDEHDRGSVWSPASTWETGLLNEAAWAGASWIGVDTSDALALDGARWIWFDEADPASGAPAGSRYLRRTFTLPTGQVTAGDLAFTADDEARVFVNGQQVADTHALRESDRDAWQKAQLVDATEQLHAGSNTIAVEVKNRTQAVGDPTLTPAGFIARLRVRSAGTTTATTVDSDGRWKASKTVGSGWEQPSFDDSGWTAARDIAPFGQGPWGGSVRVPAVTSSPYLRKDFSTRGAVASARLSVTALGLYEIHLNGRKVGDHVLAPGWTEYDKRVPAQTYDVTDMVRSGDNAIGASLGEGWYAGRLQGGRRWGSSPALRAKLRLTYADGSTQTVGTDSSWTVGSGGVRESGIYDGETFDARREQAGWDQPGFDGSGRWTPAVVRDETTAVEPTAIPPIRVIDTLTPKSVTKVGDDTWVFDLGQNFAGWARLHVQGAAGTTVQMKFGELLNDDGTVYRDNLRSALQTDSYTLRGGGPETYEPRFTYHGFRYVEVSGLTEPPTTATLDGRVVSTDLASFGHFSTSNPLVDQIQKNIVWGQRSNFLAVPSDASQRDERLGWTGDIQAFASTAAFNGDTSGYLEQWLQTLRDGQSASGAFPDVAPKTCCGEGTAGWGDAGTVVPWTLYQRYGDERVLRDNYPSMKRWVDYLKANSTNLIRPNSGYGDWLAPDNTPQDLIGTAFFAYSTDIVRKAAKVLGNDADVQALTTLHDQIAAAFAQRWVRSDGYVGSGSQTSYVLALHMGLVPDALRGKAFARLADDVVSRGNHLSTGFLGTPFLLSTLAEGGRTDIAYRLLTQQSYPSWGYMIGRGATTIWERWDGIRPDGSLQDIGMNSFNHFGLGSIGDWLYGSVGGLAPDEDGPGYQRFVVRPTPGAGVDDATSSVESGYGRMSSAWSRTGSGDTTIDVEVPVNTTATVHVPVAAGQELREDGQPVVDGDGVRTVARANGETVLEVGSGRYHFVAATPPAPGGGTAGPGTTPAPGPVVAPPTPATPRPVAPKRTAATARSQVASALNRQRLRTVLRSGGLKVTLRQAPRGRYALAVRLSGGTRHATLLQATTTVKTTSVGRRAVRLRLTAAGRRTLRRWVEAQRTVRLRVEVGYRAPGARRDVLDVRTLLVRP